jgi:hypothetical protein
MGITGRTSSRRSLPSEPLLRLSISRLVIYASLQGPTSLRHHGDERWGNSPYCFLSCRSHSEPTIGIVSGTCADVMRFGMSKLKYD